jgi:hypothetical protein
MGPKLLTLPSDARIIILALVVIIVLVRLAMIFFSRSKPHNQLASGAPRDYGLGGGGICPKCHRLTPISLMSLKFGFNTRLARCEHCGQWSLIHRVSLAELRAAEAAESTTAQPAPTADEKDQAEKDLIDKSRYV